MTAWLPLLLLLSGAADQTPSPGPSRTVTCSFSNPSYSGWCRVTENVPSGSTPRKVCLSVLACLNDVRCVKTYCNATPIRMNWKLEPVNREPKRSR